MREQEQEKPKLAPELEIYGKTGGYFKKTDKEVDETVEKNREKRETEKAKEKVAEAVEKGEVKFGGIESKKVNNKKPSFEEYKAKQQAEQEEVLEKAREELEKKYEELEKIKRAA